MFAINEWYTVSFTGEVEGDVTGRCTAVHGTGVTEDDGTENVIVRLDFSNDQGTMSFPFPSDDIVSVSQTS